MFALCSRRTRTESDLMPDRRGPKASMEDLIPADRVSWAQEIWRDRHALASTHSGAWMLREAAKTLGLPEEAVDEILKSGGH